ncbi:thiol reductase thioredoxin [Pigmentiphaga sp. NML080357]|uniref:thioredoxin family protein n=1 Tax=Pigmentiphaga sp. NML080357 TaxID=2008675 RepID=UPI000B4122B3|nr:thioredoxin family protein [Pigmentiphaga sp. NML080357]OVZ61222.1 thiol reductase thioredoxin [Pigmentiphaga sp. NML080357]
MSMNTVYATQEPTRAEIDALQEPAVLEFGAPWCGYCQAAQPLLEAAFEGHAKVRHLKVEDGKGRPLGRSFGVKLWPTLVFLDRGQEVARLVRPAEPGAIREALALIDPAV